MMFDKIPVATAFFLGCLIAMFASIILRLVPNLYWVTTEAMVATAVWVILRDRIVNELPFLSYERKQK